MIVGFFTHSKKLHFAMWWCSLNFQAYSAADSFSLEKESSVIVCQHWQEHDCISVYTFVCILVYVRYLSREWCMICRMLRLLRITSLEDIVIPWFTIKKQITFVVIFYVVHTHCNLIHELVDSDSHRLTTWFSTTESLIHYALYSIFLHSVYKHKW